MGSRSLETIVKDMASIPMPPEPGAAAKFNGLRQIVKRQLSLAGATRTADDDQVRHLIQSHLEHVASEMERLQDITGTGTRVERDSRHDRLKVCFAEERAYRRLLELFDEARPAAA